MKKLFLTAMAALALVLTFSQCKKEIERPEAEGGVFVTLKAHYEQSGDRTDLNVSFVWPESYTQYIYVGGSKHDGCIGVLSGIGTGNETMVFTGNLTEVPQFGEILYFFYLGEGEERRGDALTTLDFSNQNGTPENLNHIAISYGVSFKNFFIFEDTFHMMMSIAYVNTGGFVNSNNEKETVSLLGDDVYSTATIDFRNGKIIGKEKGNIIIGEASNGAYVELIPSTQNETTLEFDSESKTGYITFLSGIRAGMFYSKINLDPLSMDPLNMEASTPPLATPLTFEAKESGATVTLTVGNSKNTIPSLKYKINDGGWTDAGLSSSNRVFTSQPLNVGDKISFRATTVNSSMAEKASAPFASVFSTNKQCFVYGNVMSLLYKVFTSKKEFPADYNFTFSCLFNQCANLYNHESKPILLPATKVAYHGYSSMFKDCTQLTVAPELPATTLAERCYNNMFDGCSALTTVPASLPATTLAKNCYQGMFNKCSSLVTAPVLPAPTLVDYCYMMMFVNCSSLSNVTCLATDINANKCVYNWLNNVATSGTFITPTSTSWETGTSGIPSGWTRVNAQ